MHQFPCMLPSLRCSILFFFLTRFIIYGSFIYLITFFSSPSFSPYSSFFSPTSPFASSYLDHDRDDEFSFLFKRPLLLSLPPLLLLTVLNVSPFMFTLGILRSLLILQVSQLFQVEILLQILLILLSYHLCHLPRMMVLPLAAIMSAYVVLLIIMVGL